MIVWKLYRMSSLSPHIKKIEQAAFWVFIWLFVFDYFFLQDNWLEAIAITSLDILLYAVLIYTNLQVLIPIFLAKKKNMLYVFVLFTTIILYILFLRITGLEKIVYNFAGWRNVFSMVLNTTLFLLLSLLYWYFKQWQLEREGQLVLQNQKLEAELNFLRSQMSPHFMFNALNNIYSLSLQKHDNAAPMVAKLSSLLRYMLYEGNGGRVFLNKEIETVRQYIELNLLRKLKSTNVDFYIEGNLKGWMILPMLLITLAENCFKHSNVNNEESAFIKICGEIHDDGKLIFTTENSIPVSLSENEIGGIGLQNVRRQLELNYPEKYMFETEKSESVFNLHLTIQLNQA